jgi:hypothetical protein
VLISAPRAPYATRRCSSSASRPAAVGAAIRIEPDTAVWDAFSAWSNPLMRDSVRTWVSANSPGVSVGLRQSPSPGPFRVRVSQSPVRVRVWLNGRFAEFAATDNSNRRRR